MNKTYILLVDWSNGTTEYVESRSKSDCERRLKSYRQASDVEYIRVIENPKSSYSWSNPNCSPEGDWI